MAAIEPNSWASARAAVGPTCRIDSATSTRHSGRCLAEPRLASSRSPLAESCGPSSPFLGARVNSARLLELVLGRARTGRPRCRSPRRRAAPPRPRSRAPRCRTPRARRRGRPARAPGPGRTGGWGSAGPCRPPSAGPAASGRRGTSSASSRAAGPSGRSGSTGPRISGITSPALRRITVSPGRTSLRLTSWALCSVAFSTVEPATRVGSMTPYGVARPVRPTLTRMSRSLALTSSGGYLNAIAQRGARLVEPSRRWSATSSTLITTPSISYARDRVAVLAGVLDEGLDLLERRQHLDVLGGRQPPRRERGVGLGLRRRLEALRACRCRGRPCRARGRR